MQFDHHINNKLALNLEIELLWYMVFVMVLCAAPLFLPKTSAAYTYTQTDRQTITFSNRKLCKLWVENTWEIGTNDAISSSQAERTYIKSNAIYHFVRTTRQDKTTESIRFISRILKYLSPILTFVFVRYSPPTSGAHPQPINHSNQSIHHFLHWNQFHARDE